MNPCFTAGTALRNQKLPGSVSHVKDHAACTRLGQRGIDFAVRKNNRKLLREHISMDVPRPHFFQHQIFVGPVRTRPKIVHHRYISEGCTFNRAIHRRPRHMLCIPRLSSSSNALSLLPR